MQGPGFLFALLPAAKKFFPDRRRRIEFLQRQCGFFNAQPYCASLALGLVLRRERDLAGSTRPGDAHQQDEIVKSKENLCGPLGLLGDQLFWQILKPAAAGLGMIAVLLRGHVDIRAGLLGALVFLLAFNPLHIWMRWWGLKTGYQAGDNLSSHLAQGVLPLLRRRLAAAGSYLAWVLAVVGFTFCRRELGSASWVAFVLSFILMNILLRRQVPISAILLAIAAVSLMPAVLGLL